MMSPDEVDKFIAALDNTFLRRGAVRELARLGDVRAAEPLINAVRNDDDPKLIEPVTRGLIRIGEGALPALLDAIHSDNKTLRELAAEVLGEIGSQAAVKPLIGILLNDPAKFVKMEAVASLGKLGSSEAVDPLITMLGSEDKFLRWTVVEALGEIGDIRAVEPLVNMLNDESEEVKTATQQSLDKLGYKLGGVIDAL
ncbi:MAG: HEAT repeat domain-containing protein [Chloroflexota bacterium]